MPFCGPSFRPRYLARSRARAPSPGRPIPACGSSSPRPPTNQVSASEAGQHPALPQAVLATTRCVAGRLGRRPWASAARRAFSFSWIAVRRLSDGFGAEQVVARRDTGRRSWHSRTARAAPIRAGSACRSPPRPSCALAMSAVITLASMVLALTSGAVRKARNANCSSIWPLMLPVQVLPGQVARRPARTECTRARLADRA